MSSWVPPAKWEATSLLACLKVDVAFVLLSAMLEVEITGAVEELKSL